MNLRRKRLRLMRDTQWRGYARTAEGNPITLSQIRSVATLSVLGNSAQDGTPSPDNPVEVVGTGELQEDGRYKITVQAGGRNLIDYTKAEPRTSGQTVDIIGNGVKWSGNYYFQIPVNGLKINKSYALSCKSNNGAFWNVRYKDGTNSSNCQNNGSFKILKEAEYIFIYKSNYTVFENDIIVTDIALYEGTYNASTMPPYEPYKEPQSFNVYTHDVLHGVGDAHDTVVLDFDKRKAELVKYAGYFDLNNINAIAISGSMDGVLYRHYFRPDLLMKSGTGLVGFCNVLPESPLWTGNNIENVHFGQSNQAIYFMTTNQYDNKDDLIAYLSNKGQSTPYVIYPLATPTTTDITALQDWDALPQLHGTWILTAEGGTEPTLRAEYYSEERSTE